MKVQILHSFYAMFFLLLLHGCASYNEIQQNRRCGWFSCAEWQKIQNNAVLTDSAGSITNLKYE